MIKKSQEDEFYRDIDAKTARRSFCTWPLMVVFFVVVLILALIIVFLLFKSFKNRADFSSQAPNLQTVYKLFTEKLKVDSSTQPTFQISLNSQDLENLFQEVSVGGIKVKNIDVVIDELGVVFFGAMTENLKQSVRVSTVPQVENGKIKMEVNKITIGTFAVPQIFYPVTESSLNSLLDKNFENLYKQYKVERIELSTDKMIIYGSLKER